MIRKTFKAGLSKFVYGTIIAAALGSSMYANASDNRLKFAGTLPADSEGSKMMYQVKKDIEAANVGLKVSVFPANCVFR